MLSAAEHVQIDTALELNQKAISEGSLASQSIEEQKIFEEVKGPR